MKRGVTVIVKPLSSYDLKQTFVPAADINFHCIHDTRNPQAEDLILNNVHFWLNVEAPESNKEPERSPTVTFLMKLLEIYRNHYYRLGLEADPVDYDISPLCTGNGNIVLIR